MAFLKNGGYKEDMRTGGKHKEKPLVLMSSL
jgi:hypothetical protein